MNRYLKLSLLTLSIFGCIETSESETFEKNNAYQKYFETQKKINEGIIKLNIPGTRTLSIDGSFAEKVLTTCPDEINRAISGIEQNIFNDNEKNIILHGLSGTSKSCLAQAIAIKSQTPCIFVNAGSISTQYMNSGVQNLNKIFTHAKSIEKEHGKCIVILDELEGLTKKHANKENHENNILVSLWQEVDTVNNSNIMVVGTMNSIEDLPVQMTNRTSMIKVPLPKLDHRQTILSHHRSTKGNKHNLTYSKWVTDRNLALLTKGFSHRDLQNTVTRATKQAALDKNNKVVTLRDFATIIRAIKKDPKRRLEREAGTWKDTVKTCLRDSKTCQVALGIAAMSFMHKGICQAREIANEQMSAAQIAKTATINSSILGIPVGMPIYWVGKGCCEGVKYIRSKF